MVPPSHQVPLLSRGLRRKGPDTGGQYASDQTSTPARRVRHALADSPQVVQSPNIHVDTRSEPSEPCLCRLQGASVNRYLSHGRSVTSACPAWQREQGRLRPPTSTTAAWDANEVAVQAVRLYGEADHLHGEQARGHGKLDHECQPWVRVFKQALDRAQVARRGGALDRRYRPTPSRRGILPEALGSADRPKPSTEPPQRLLPRGWAQHVEAQCSPPAHPGLVHRRQGYRPELRVEPPRGHAPITDRPVPNVRRTQVTTCARQEVLRQSMRARDWQWDDRLAKQLGPVPRRDRRPQRFESTDADRLFQRRRPLDSARKQRRLRLVPPRRARNRPRSSGPSSLKVRASLRGRWTCSAVTAHLQARCWCRRVWAPDPDTAWPSRG